MTDAIGTIDAIDTLMQFLPTSVNKSQERLRKNNNKKKTDTLLLQLSSFPPQGPQLAVV